MKKMPVIFVGHGDPMLALKRNEMTETLKNIGKDIIKNHGEPKAICPLVYKRYFYSKC